MYICFIILQPTLFFNKHLNFMKILKIVGIVLIVLVAIIIVLGLVAPKEFSAERHTTIEAPLELVFNTVNDLSTWESWSPWKEMDPEMKVTLGETTVGEGASYTWTGEESGSGKMTILTSNPHENLETEVFFDGMGSAKGPWSFEATEEGTKVSWGFQSKIPFPWNALMLFQNMEAAVQKDFDRGLELLKSVVEEKAQQLATTYNGYRVQLVDVPVRYFVAVRETISIDEISEHYAKNLPKIGADLGAKGIEMAGMPCGLFYSFDEEKQETEVAQAIPVKEKVTLGEYAGIELPAGKALLIEYYGDYENLVAAHEAMDKYVEENGIKTGMPVIEEYVTDPGTEPDPAKWLTKVYYPVEL